VIKKQTKQQWHLAETTFIFSFIFHFSLSTFFASVKEDSAALERANSRHQWHLAEKVWTRQRQLTHRTYRRSRHVEPPPPPHSHLGRAVGVCVPAHIFR